MNDKKTKSKKVAASQMISNGITFPFAEIKSNGGLKRKIVQLVLNSERPDDDCFLCDFLMALQYILDEHSFQSADLWIKCSDRLPEPNTKVLVILDYRKWKKDMPLRIEKANVWHTVEPRPFGGPNALSGQGYLTGTYFSIPAVIHPDTVTHWMPLPKNL